MHPGDPDALAGIAELRKGGRGFGCTPGIRMRQFFFLSGQTVSLRSCLSWIVTVVPG